MNTQNILKKYISVLTFLTIALALLQLTAFAGGKKNTKDTKKARQSMQQKTLWQQVEQESVQLLSAQPRLPEKYLIFRLDRSALKNSLAELPLQNTDAAQKSPLVMEIPMPDGSIQRFRMEETQVLSPELAADFPDWKTFTGYGIDNPGAIGQFDWNVLGFHGYVSTGRDTVLIDPYQKGDTKNYLVYNKSEYGKSDGDFYCNIGKGMERYRQIRLQTRFSAGCAGIHFRCNQVRTYRLAVATTGEWTRNAGNYPTVTDPVTLRTNALAVVMSAVNRLNGIYVRELASQFQLVNPSVSDDARNIIFDDPATDPYDNTDSLGAT